MSSVNLEAALEILRYVPPLAPQRLVVSRRHFLMEAARLRQRRATCSVSPFRPAEPSRAGAWWRSSFSGAWTTVRRVLVAALGVLFVGGMLAGLVSAAQAAGPTSSLYAVKLAWEDVRLALAWEPQARLALVQDLAGARVEEIEGLVQAGQNIPSPPLDRLERLLRLELEAASRLGDRQMLAALEQIEETARVHVRTMEQALPVAGPHNRAALEVAVRLLNQVRERARLGMSDPNAFRLASGWVELPHPTLSPTETPASLPTHTVLPGRTASRVPTPSATHPTTPPGGPGPSPVATSPAGPGPGPVATPHRTSGQAQTVGPAPTPGPDHTPGHKHTSEPGRSGNGPGD